MVAPTPAETLAAKQARENCKYRLFLDKTPAAALTSEEKTEKIVLEPRYRILGDISDLNVNSLGALLSVFIQELDPVTFKRRKEGVAKARRFAKEWQKNPGFE